MPFIYKYKCNNEKGCDFQIVDVGAILYAKLDNGRIKQLSHPIEEAESLALTGKSVVQLMRENRAFYKDSELCLLCFKEKGECKCKNKNRFIATSGLKDKKCPKCKKGIIQRIIVGQS